MSAYYPVPTAYSNTYQAETPTPSMRKLRLVAHQASEAGFANLIAPEPVRRDDLVTIHDATYVDSILTGRGELADCAFGFWNEAYRDGVLAICGGNLLAAELAFQHGIAANVGGGFHHARPDTGAGYCTFNGLALVAALHPDLHVLVIDCDEHAGDGTAEFAKTLPNLTNFSICGTHLDCEQNERSIIRHIPPRDETAYRHAIREALDFAAATRPGLVIYQAGMDPHKNDPLGRSKMTAAVLAERDETIMSTLANDLEIPFFFVLAGGYQEPMEKSLVPLHLKTFEIAARMYAGRRHGDKRW